MYFITIKRGSAGRLFFPRTSSYIPLKLPLYGIQFLMTTQLLFAIGAQPSYGTGIIRIKGQRALAAALAACLSTLPAARSRFGFQLDDIALSSAASLASKPNQYQEDQNGPGRNPDHPPHVYSTSDMCRLFVQNSYKTKCRFAFQARPKRSYCLQYQLRTFYHIFIVNRGSCSLSVTIDNRILGAQTQKSLLTPELTGRKAFAVLSFMQPAWCQIFNSPSFINSTTACERPLTFNFCMTLEMWLRTVFSLINNCPAISRVVLSCTSNSNTSRSRWVNKNLLLWSVPFNGVTPPCPGMCGLTRLRDTVNSSYVRSGGKVRKRRINWAFGPYQRFLSLLPTACWSMMGV